MSAGALIHNLRALQALAPNWQIAPVLKSNAYGHGLVLVANILQEQKNIPFFCVDSYFEAEVIRNAGIKKPLLVIGHSKIETIKNNKFDDVTFTIGSFEQLNELAKTGAHCTIHIKFDTGLHRRGIDPAQIENVANLIKHSKKIRVDGLLSHLADADTPNSLLTKKQIDAWNTIAEYFQKKFPSIQYYHISKSAGFAYANEINANVARPGITLYGINPGNLNAKLQPALCMKSIISEVRLVEAGESIGYNATFIAIQKMKIATIPAGYYEGVDRRLSNQGAFLIDGIAAPLIGRVSMNITSCDITKIYSAKIGSQVVIMSNNSSDQNSIENISKLCKTIPYEILVHIPQHIKRATVDNF